MKRTLMTAAALVLMNSLAMAGPDAGGTIIVRAGLQRMWIG